MRLTRRLIQLGFLVLTLVGVFVVQGHTERWCPFGGVEALYSYTTLGNMTCSLGTSNFYILAGVLVLALLARRAFCGYACPIGALSEWLQAGARRLGLRPARVPYDLDRGLALLKYAVLGVIIYFTARVGELVFRGYDPCYVLISRHGEDITVWAYVVTGAIVLGSLFVMVPFCRWLCPLAAVFTPFSRIGLARIQRNHETCVDCGACARACPMGIRVDKVPAVTAARCTSCLECLCACPPKISALRWGPPKWLRPAWPAWLSRSPAPAVALLVLACLGGAVAASYATPLPSFVHVEGQSPSQTASVTLQVRGVKCRHSTEMFVKQLLRNDELKVRGYLRVDAWPAPGQGKVRITYDPQRASERLVKQAITEPTIDPDGNLQPSDYAIEGYDPLGL
jgi:polyferredoxin